MRYETLVGRVICDVISSDDVRSAVKYLRPTEIVRVTRKFKPSRRDKRTDLAVTLGQPNYRERQFIKLAQKAGEPFPIRKIIVKGWPKKK